MNQWTNLLGLSGFIRNISEWAPDIVWSWWKDNTTIIIARRNKKPNCLTQMNKCLWKHEVDWVVPFYVKETKKKLSAWRQVLLFTFSLCYVSNLSSLVVLFEMKHKGEYGNVRVRALLMRPSVDLLHRFHPTPTFIQWVLTGPPTLHPTALHVDTKR